MDILIHIVLIILIALLFYISRLDKSNNPLLFIIIITVICIVILWQDSTYITTGYNTIASHNYTTGITTSNTIPIQETFNFEWMLYLVYIAFFWLSTIMFGAREDFGDGTR